MSCDTLAKSTFHLQFRILFQMSASLETFAAFCHNNNVFFFAVFNSFFGVFLSMEMFAPSFPVPSLFYNKNNI